MTTYVALFRAINVGGKNALPMKALASILGEVGCENVRTYIQSGNAVFTCQENNALVLSDRIREAVSKERGFEPTVLLLTPEEVEKAIAENPFPDAASDHKALHVRFLASLPIDPDLMALERLSCNGEQFQLKGKVFYLYAPMGVGKSKLAASAERVLGVPMTDRNWKTVCTLRDMAKEVAGR